MRIQLLTMSVLTLLAAMGACNGNSQLETTRPLPIPGVETVAPPPPATITGAPTAAEPSPTGTPAPAVTATTDVAPTARPVPTATPRWTIPTPSIPTPMPTADDRREAEERTAFEFINSLSENVRGMTTAFDLDMELAVVWNGQETIIPVTLDGDFQGGVFFGAIPSYSRSRMTVGVPAGQESLEVISVPGRMYVRREFETEWREIPVSVDRTVTPDPRAFVFDSRQDTSHLTRITVEGEEILDGVNALVISAFTSDIEFFGSPGEFDVTYWFGKEDGNLVKVNILGEIILFEDSLLGREIAAESADLSMVARFYDHGKGVEVFTPELLYGTFGHAAQLLDDGRVLVTGGFNAAANANTIVPFPASYAQIYSFETGVWKSVGGVDLVKQERLPGPDIYNSAIRLPDGVVLVFGIDSGKEMASSGVVHQLGENQDTWEFVAGGGLPRFATDMVLLADGRVLIGGGVELSDDDSGRDISTEVEIFDPTTRTWATAAAMPLTGRGQELVLLQDGRVLAIHRNFRNNGQPSAQLYDPLADSWSFTGEMVRNVTLPTAVTMDDGRVLVTAAPAYSSKGYSESHLFDPASGTWETHGTGEYLISLPMNQPRENHTLTLLPDGRVLAVGGDDFFEGDVPEDRRGTTEIFDPATSRWSPGPDLQELRSNHAATLLPNGRVFLTGGIGLVVSKDEIAPIFTTEFVEP